MRIRFQYTCVCRSLDWDLGAYVIQISTGSWYQVLGTKCLVPRMVRTYWLPKYLVPSTSAKCLIPSAWYQVHGTKCLVPSTLVVSTSVPKYLVTSTWVPKYLVPSTWYQAKVFCTNYLVQAICYSCACHSI